jgi:HlyD family secretion protein
VPVKTEPARRRDIATTVYGMGRCEPLPRKIATLTPAVEGQVAEILANQGDSVHQGQPIVQFNQTIARASVAEKSASRDGTQASLRLLESLPRTEEQQGAKLAITQAEMAVAKARATVDRLRPLRAKNEIPEAQMVEAELALRQAQVQQQAAEAQLVVLMLKPRPQAIDEAKTKIATAEATVKLAEEQLRLHTICSPIEGVLDSLSCRLGQTVAIGAPIGEVVDSRQVDVVVWLPVPDVRLVRVGQPAQIHPSGIAESPAEHAEQKDAPAEAIAGKVTFVGRVADPQTGNLPVRILVDNAQGRLIAGQIAGATITVAVKKDVLAVPADALVDAGEGTEISVVRDGKSVVLHPKLGVQDNRWVEVLDTDLKPEEPVIVEGAYALPDRTPVTIEPAKSEAKEEKKDEKRDEEKKADDPAGARPAEKPGKGASS